MNDEITKKSSVIGVLYELLEIEYSDTMTDTSNLFLPGKKSKATNTAFEKKFSQGEPFSQHLNYHEIEIYMDVNRCRKKVKMEVLLLDGLFLVKKLFIVFVSCDAVFIVNSQPI